jgi:hypothetical protein
MTRPECGFVHLNIPSSDNLRRARMSKRLDRQAAGQEKE